MSAHGASAKLVILVVDEETQVRDAICEHLQGGGFQVVAAEDSDTALDLLKTRSDVAAAVIDAHLPGTIDGPELVRQVRQDWPTLGVVMTSGHSDETSGPVPDGSIFINKPNLFEQLIPALRRMMAPGA